SEPQESRTSRSEKRAPKMTKKNYHKPAEDPRTIGGGLKAQGRERREKLMTMINSRPRHARNDLLPEMKLQTLAIADLNMPKHMVRKLDQGHKATKRRVDSFSARERENAVCIGTRFPERGQSL